MKFPNPFQRSKTKINLHPKNAAPVSFYKSIHLQENWLGGSNSEICRRGYTNNFMGTREPGILVHGTPEGKMYFIDGIETLGHAINDWEYQSYVASMQRDLTPLEFCNHLKRRFSLDLSIDKKPLHLICCFSGRPENLRGVSIAQQLSNILQRRIWAYGGHEEIITRDQTKGLIDMMNNTGQILDSDLRKITPRLIHPRKTTPRR